MTTSCVLIYAQIFDKPKKSLKVQETRMQKNKIKNSVQYSLNPKLDSLLNCGWNIDALLKPFLEYSSQLRTRSHRQREP